MTPAGTGATITAVSSSLCEHRWRYLPTLDSNPPTESRECVVCSLVEQRRGVGVDGQGARIDATEWARVRGGELVIGETVLDGTQILGVGAPSPLRYGITAGVKSRTLADERAELHRARTELRDVLLDTFRPVAVWLLEHPRTLLVAALVWASAVILTLPR
jgi:hypothetical protein